VPRASLLRLRHFRKERLEWHATIIPCACPWADGRVEGCGIALIMQIDRSDAGRKSDCARTCERKDRGPN
jgi:hypothetical protein